MNARTKNYVGASHLPGLLLASEAECARWIDAGLIPIAARKSVRAGSRAADLRLFDPAVVAALAPDVPAWRRRDADEGRAESLTRMGERRPVRAGDEVDGSEQLRRRSALAMLAHETGTAIDVVDEDRRDAVLYRLGLTRLLPVVPGTDSSVRIEATFREPPEVAAVVRGSGSLSRDDTQRIADALAPLVLALRDQSIAASEQAVAAWRDDLDVYLSAYEEDERAAILSGMSAAARRLEPVRVDARDGAGAVGPALRKALEALRTRATSRRLRLMRDIQIREASGYESYAAIFPLARSLERRILFLAGPTNSGKTHEALRLAGKAETAEILSPLRLLALEHYERLKESGLRAGMITGEERILAQDATHIARTIETLDLGRITDVCVIDEVQMLGDQSRGWAWTQAIVGAPARLVVLTGAPEAIPLVEHLLAMTGEPLEVRILKRKGVLRVEKDPADLTRLVKGDAVIAFSRTDIHDLRNRLVRAGRSVATVYGALGPEVRRAEAARFRNHEADILVATDAIGMGLNIGPLRRVVFSTLSKFDGVRRRGLTPMEIKQIAGRAGRFGHHDVGLVSALLEAGSFRQIRPAIESALTQEAVRLRGKAFVRPNRETVLSASEVLATDSLGQVLQHLDETLVTGHPDLRMADLEDMITLARLLDFVPLPILDRLSYTMAPVDVRDGLAVEMLQTWARQHAGRGWVDPPNFGVSADLLKLESRVRILTSWLWLAQRYPDVYPDAEDVVGLRQDLNAKIEEKLVASSRARTSRKAAPDGERQHRGRKPARRRGKPGGRRSSP